MLQKNRKKKKINTKYGTKNTGELFIPFISPYLSKTIIVRDRSTDVYTNNRLCVVLV